MIRHIIIDQNSRFYCSFSGPDDFIALQEIPEGMRLISKEAPEILTQDWVYINDEFILAPKEVILHYTAARMQEYPPLSDFVDAMYWNNLGDSSKLDEYNEKCAAVKLKYPKPA